MLDNFLWLDDVMEGEALGKLWRSFGGVVKRLKTFCVIGREKEKRREMSNF